MLFLGLLRKSVPQPSQPAKKPCTEKQEVLDISGGGHNGKKAKDKSDGKKSPKDENLSQKRGNDKKEQSTKEKTGKGQKNENDDKKGYKKWKSGQDEEDEEVEDDEVMNEDFENYLLQTERDSSSKIDKSNLIIKMKIDQKKEAAVKKRMQQLMKESIEESQKEEKNTKEDVAATKDVESFVAADIPPEEEHLKDNVMINTEGEKTANEEEKEEEL